MLDDLTRDIKRNCDISDAVHWGSFSICGLLMRYRDLYRSERGLQPWSAISRDDITAWIQEKESRWPSLEEQELQNLSFGGRTYAPFESWGLNTHLEPQGHVYGAGYGMYLKPTFFLARLRSVAEVEGHRIYTTDREVARDLFTAPAMHLDGVIFLRTEPLRSLLWDLSTQLRPGCTTFLAEAFDRCGIRAGMDVSDDLLERLDRMASNYLPVLLRHEIAESREAQPGWKDVLASAPDRVHEQFLRALQDLVADTSDAGPLRRIAEERNEASLALYAGLLDGFRRELLPEVRHAARSIRARCDWKTLDSARANGYARCRALRDEVTALFRQCGKDSFPAALKDLIRRASPPAAPQRAP